MAIKIVTDQEVRARIDWSRAVATIEDVMAKVARDAYVSPPRHRVSNTNGAIAFTVGGDVDEGVFGFRVYETFPTDINHEQFTTVFDAKTGALRGIVLGDYIGAARTGAIGGAAIRALSRKDSRTIGIIGSGLQARTQLLSALAVRDIDAVRVYSRSQANCEQFAADIGVQFRGEMTIAASAQDAVADADIVIVATKSGTPVLDADWLKPGCHVNTVGPKVEGRHELPVAIAERAQHLFTDSVAQMSAYAKPHFLSGHPAFDRIAPLPPVVAEPASWQRADSDITVFLSVGLAGTEPAVANLLL